jgi:hypothetical protein
MQIIVNPVTPALAPAIPRKEVLDDGSRIERAREVDDAPVYDNRPARVIGNFAVVAKAPFDGVIVSGDLSQALGSPVEKGKVLFEVAPLDQYRVILQVGERDITYVHEGETGTLTLTGLPAQPLDFHVTKVTPVANSEDGRNFFRTEAALNDARLPVRPGMEGVAKIDAGRRGLLWIWTHPLIDWARLLLWKWLP